MVMSTGDHAPTTATSLFCSEWQLPSNVGMLHLSWDWLWSEGVRQCYHSVYNYRYGRVVYSSVYLYSVEYTTSQINLLVVEK